MHIYGKTPKTLLQNRESFEAETWYIDQWLKIHHVNLSDDDGLPLTFLW